VQHGCSTIYNHSLVCPSGSLNEQPNKLQHYLIEHAGIWIYLTLICACWRRTENEERRERERERERAVGGDGVCGCSFSEPLGQTRLWLYIVEQPCCTCLGFCHVGCTILLHLSIFYEYQVFSTPYLFLATAAQLQWPVTHFSTFYQFCFLNNVV
jgi:hypothetical protein